MRAPGIKKNSNAWKNSMDNLPKEEEEKSGLMQTWADVVAKSSSLHGVAWYTRIAHGLSKTSVFVLIMIITFGMPFAMAKFFFTWLYEVEVSDSVLWSEASAIRYPNLTVCHAGFFDKERMEEFGISNDMANYLTMAFDPAAPHLMEYHEAISSTLSTTANTMGTELDAILANRSINMLELLEQIGVSCNELVIYCEVHKRMYMAKDGIPDEENCCKQIFDDRPIFTSQGVCYTAKTVVYEANPYSWSTVEFWFKYNETNTPNFRIQYKGSDAVERSGLIFAPTHLDNPVFALDNRQFRAKPGSVTTMALRVRQISRTGLGAKFCASPSVASDFSHRHSGAAGGTLPYTKLNCEAMKALSAFGRALNCSILAYMRVETDPNLPPCHPRNNLERALNHTIEVAIGGDVAIQEKEKKTSRLEEDAGEECLFECEKVEYLARLQYGDVDPKPVEEVGIDSKSVAIVQFYFETFDFEKHTLKQETIIEFFSKVGGWLSLAVGASFISFVELIYFLWLLCRTALSKKRSGVKAFKH